MAESLSENNLTRQIAWEEILNNQRRESFKSYINDYLLEFFFGTRSVSEVEELESLFNFLLFVFLLLESADVELDVELESSLLELDSVELLEVTDVDEELLIPWKKKLENVKNNCFLILKVLWPVKDLTCAHTRKN